MLLGAMTAGQSPVTAAADSSATARTAGAGAGAPGRPTDRTWKLALVVLLTAAMAVLVLLHTPGVNGPWYWQWSWRRLPVWPLYPLMLAAVAPFFAGQWVRVRFGKTAIAISLLMASTLALELAAMSAQPPGGLERLRLIVENSVNTSYYTSATFVKDLSVPDWFSVFPDMLPDLMVHAKYKPPGLILFYYGLIQLFGEGPRTALIGGLVIAVLATATVPMTYRLVRFYTRGDADAAFTAASLMALCPSLVLFLPQFDQVYPTVACGMLLTWGGALAKNDLVRAVAFGALLALSLFLSYILLIVGVFLAVFTILFMYDAGRRGVERAITFAVVAVAVVLAAYGLLWATTGYDPIATSHRITELQMKDLIPLERPFPRHIVFDLLDFALGAGWIPVLLVAFYLARHGGRVVRIFGQAPEHRLAFLALLQIVVVALAALLPGENARLWMLLYPLLMALAALELARWRWGERMTVYACLWFVMVVICQNMTFLYMGPELDGPR